MEKIWELLYNTAKSVLNARRISEYVTAGEVSAAILSKSGKYIQVSALILALLLVYVLNAMQYLI
jgi:hypothetical protein